MLGYDYEFTGRGRLIVKWGCFIPPDPSTATRNLGVYGCAWPSRGIRRIGRDVVSSPSAMPPETAIGRGGHTFCSCAGAESGRRA